MEPIFKVGEKVRVTERTFDNCDYKYEYVDEMRDMFEGQIVTIEQVYPNNSDKEYEVEDDCAVYFIKEDNGRFLWSSGMFDKIEQSHKTINKNKNKEKARKALYASLEEQGINIY